MYLVNARIITMDPEGTILERGYMHIQNGVIESIGSMDSLALPQEEITIDALGNNVYPGWIDCHTHLGMFEEGICFEGDDGNEDTDPITPQLRAIDGVNPMDHYFEEALEGGVTTVLISPGSTNPIAGQIAAIKTLGKRIDRMILKAPAAIKFSLGENPKSTYNDKEQTPVTRMAVASLIRETLYRAKKYMEDKERSEAEGEETDPPEFDSKCEALMPLLKGDIPAHFHAHRADDIFTALRISQEFSIPCLIVHGTEAHLVPEELKGECLGVLSGPFLTDRSKPELKHLTPASPGILAAANIPTAIITDHPETPINYLTLCAAVAVREGMSREKALRAITSDAAALCGIGHRVGSLEIGKDADFVMYRGDPLDLMQKPVSVMCNGVYRTLENTCRSCD